MKIETSTKTLSRNQSGPSGAHGPCQPAKNNVTASADSVIMLTYSAVWKRPQRMPLYSVWYPATSSCSASGRSKGARFVSAMPAMKKMISPTNCGAAYHQPSCCSLTMSTSESEPAISTTPSTLSASATSYETSCAHVRMAPSSENFESDAQPPTMKP